MMQYFVILEKLVENNIFFAFCNASPKENELSLESTCHNQLSLTIK